MGKDSSIQWTDATWNIARGCTKVDEDCRFCYMYRDSFDSKRYNPLQVVRTKTVFDFPLRYKETKSSCWDGRPLIFTSSLTDFFHEAIDSYRDEAWDIIRKCPHLIFQILTKRPERIKEHLPADWGDGWDNVWLGTSCGSQKSTYRIVELIQVPAKVRFLSLEPLWGAVDLTNIIHRICGDDAELKPLFGNTHSFDVLRGEYAHGKVGYNCPKIDWVIVGGESGNDIGKYQYRPCLLSWIGDIVKGCQQNNVPVFVKQMGTDIARQLHMRDRHGGNINEFPESLMIRQFPKLN